MRSSYEAERAAQLVEDVLRTHPDGASTRLLLDRLMRVGVELPDAVALLRALEDQRRIETDGERWRLA